MDRCTVCARPFRPNWVFLVEIGTFMAAFLVFVWGYSIGTGWSIAMGGIGGCALLGVHLLVGIYWNVGEIDYCPGSGSHGYP